MGTWAATTAPQTLMKVSTWALLLVVVSLNVGNTTAESLRIIPDRNSRAVDLLLSLLQPRRRQQTDSRRHHGRALAPPSKYCAISEQHTACKFTKPNQMGKCAPVKERGIGEADKKLLLKLHNDLRAKVARGEVPNQPPASNMNELVWHDESAAIAQLWIDQCAQGHDQTDPFNGYKWRGTVLDGKDVTENGQNLAGVSSRPAGRFTKDFILDRMVNSWFNESKVMDPKLVESYGPSDRTVGHYTEMVWATLRTVGCGYIRMVDEDGLEMHRLGCNYGGGDGGNVLGQPIYNTAGEPCDNCPDEDNMVICVNRASLCRKKRPGRSLMLEQLLGLFN